MSTQKLKKGFTLIELMVVIVIIGILAAIAIPKLFGMSAKAKAQEVGPAAGTYVKLQQAYIIEAGKGIGTPKDIAYVLPGNNTSDGNESATSNFSYTVGSNGAWTATPKFTADVCTASIGTWNVTITDVGVASAVPGCTALTPNFASIK